MPTVLASDLAFGIVFGLFVVALLVLFGVVLIWAVRRDRAGRDAWRQRAERAERTERAERAEHAELDGSPRRDDR